MGKKEQSINMKKITALSLIAAIIGVAIACHFIVVYNIKSRHTDEVKKMTQKIDSIAKEKKSLLIDKMAGDSAELNLMFTVDNLQWKYDSMIYFYGKPDSTNLYCKYIQYLNQEIDDAEADMQENRERILFYKGMIKRSETQIQKKIKDKHYGTDKRKKVS